MVSNQIGTAALKASLNEMKATWTPNTKQQVGKSWTALDCQLSCGGEFAQGEANLAKRLERRDVIVRNGVYYEPTHTMDSAELHSAGVEGSGLFIWKELKCKL